MWCEQWSPRKVGVILINKEVFDVFFLLVTDSILFGSSLSSTLASASSLLHSNPSSVCVHSSSYLFSFTTVVYYSFCVSPSWAICTNCRCVRVSEHSFMILCSYLFSRLTTLTPVRVKCNFILSHISTHTRTQTSDGLVLQ